MKDLDPGTLVVSVVCATCVTILALIDWEMMLIFIVLFFCLFFAEASLAVLSDILEFIKRLFKRN
jgi:hypothetical protein